MSPSGSTMEEKLSSIMDVLAKAAVSEISQLFSEASATLQLQITQSREENEALRTRMKEMRSELFSLRLQTRSKASGAAIRFALTRDNICKPETSSLGNGLKPLMDHKAVGHSPFHSRSKSEASSVTSPAEETPNIILIRIEEDISGCRPAEDCDAFGDCSTQSGATLESLHVDAAGSSHVFSQNAELRILSVHGRGGGQLVMEGHDTLFTASEVEALNSLSADCSVAQSLDCGERMDCRKQLAVQETQDNFLKEEEEDIGGFWPPVEDCSDIKDCSTQHGAASDSLHPDAPGSSHMFSPVHSREKPYRCEQCMKGFKRRGELTTHMRIHSGEKPYRCDQCLKGFKRRCELTTHMRIHSGEKPYRCDQCMKRFSQSGHLTMHMRIHSREKPHRCDQCMKRFSQSCSLKKHMMIHSGEKPYRCDQCMKRFSRSFSLKIHMRIHSTEKPYRCDQCMKSFKRSYDLKIHMRVHSGEKPYRCDQCMKRFSQSISLKTHMRIHSKEKPYRCDQCMKGFSQSCHLKIHMRIHSR
ncbi:unnamed protein product [Gadus morhua 'NCC']